MRLIRLTLAAAAFACFVCFSPVIAQQVTRPFSAEPIASPIASDSLLFSRMGTGTFRTSFGNVAALVKAIPQPIIAAPTPVAGNTMVYFGDSISAGNGATSCNLTDNAGTCYADLVSKFYGLTEVNKGVTGAPAEITTSAQSYATAFNSIAGITRYQTDLIPYCQSSNYLTYEFGINDVGISFDASISVAITPATLKSTTDTILAACNAAGMPYSHMRLIGITAHNSDTFPVSYDLNVMLFLNGPVASASEFNARTASFTAALADEAQARGTLFASTFDVLSEAGLPNALSPDGTHPSDAGHAALAAAVEQANFVDASTAQAYNLLSAAFGGGINSPVIGDITLGGSFVRMGLNQPVSILPGAPNGAASLETSVGSPAPIATANSSASPCPSISPIGVNQCPSPAPTNAAWDFGSDGHIYFNAGNGATTWSTVI